MNAMEMRLIEEGWTPAVGVQLENPGSLYNHPTGKISVAFDSSQHWAMFKHTKVAFEVASKGTGVEDALVLATHHLKETDV